MFLLVCVCLCCCVCVGVFAMIAYLLLVVVLFVARLLFVFCVRLETVVAYVFFLTFD